MNTAEKKVGLQTGELVRLKSGGPTMTVCSENPDETYCMWFNDKGERKGDTFPNSALEKL